jgi:hypothetical protein
LGRIKTKLWRGRVEMYKIVGKLYLCIMCSFKKKQYRHILHIISLSFDLKKQSKTSRNLLPKIITGALYAPKNICTFATIPKKSYFWYWGESCKKPR